MTKYQVTTFSVDEANAIGAATRDMTDRESRLWERLNEIFYVLKQLSNFDEHVKELLKEIEGENNGKP